jgi:hypothetical protein
MQDFLIFKTFITPILLLFIYYIGAVLIPLFSWLVSLWIKKRYFSNLSNKIKSEIKRNTTFLQRLLLIGAFIFCFLCMELFWRVMFEFFIAYFDMHDALMKLK